jgi:hypothetical protein
MSRTRFYLLVGVVVLVLAAITWVAPVWGVIFTVLSVVAYVSARRGATRQHETS